MSAPSDRLFHHRGFVLFWISRLLAALGFQMTGVAIGWLVYDKTGSAFDLGLIGLVQFLPIVTLTFVVGPAADRFDRRRITMAAQLVEAAALAFLTIGTMLDSLDMAQIFAAIALIGAGRAFEHPTLTAFLPAIVPPTMLPRAIAAQSSVVQTATILGPSFGGLLYVFGPQVPLAVAGFAFLGASIAIALVKATTRQPSRDPVTLESVFRGVSFIWGRPVILGAISLDLFAVLLGGATALMPIFARDILETGPWGLGLLRAAPATGAIAMSIVLSRVPLAGAVGRKMFAAVGVFGVATLVFSLSSNLYLSLVALAALGAADNVSVVIRHSLVQLSTPDDMRGRVTAVNSLFIGTSNQLGEFESGVVAALLGAVGSGIVGGLGTLIVAIAWMRLFPALRDIDRLPQRTP